MKLLMVDDEIYALQGILDSVDWDSIGFEEVLTANSYSQALNIFLKYPCDVLLCDIEMPYGTGIDLVEWVKKNHPKTECIFLTCHDDFKFARMAVSLGCLDYILKPATPEELTAALSGAVRTVQEKEIHQKYLEYGRILVDNLDTHSIYDPRQKIYDQESAVKKAEKYIRKNITEQITIQTLADTVHMSPDYLARRFKQCYGKTIVQYVTDVRMFLASELLLKGTLPVHEVAKRVGYQDTAYFIRVFKKTYGHTPNAHKREA